jgi:hypothetical protein
MKNNNVYDKEFVERLIEVMSVQSSSYKTKDMRKFIKRKLREIDGVTMYSKDGNLYAVKGEIGDDEKYPCCVSHTDTVHDIVKEFKVYEQDGWLFAMDTHKLLQAGIGGDDKVGIFVCLEMMRRCDTIKCAFFRDEEVGCIGSSEADMSFFEDVGYVFECDRKGNTDFVTSISGELSSPEFQESIEPVIKDFGYKFTDGGLTDVDQLKDNGLDVCVANMSCGYYRPHTSEEVVSIYDVYNVSNMVESLINHLGCNEWHHYRPAYSSRYSNYGYDWYGDWCYSSKSKPGKYQGVGETHSLDSDKSRELVFNPETNQWVEIAKALNTDDIDTRCPSCQHELVGSSGVLWCDNNTCDSVECDILSDKIICTDCGDYEYENTNGDSSICQSCYWSMVEYKASKLWK